MAISIKNLTVSIGKKDILHDESVGIADGSKVGLIGRNGVGKTTLIKAILGQVDYTGHIEFDGKAAHFSQHIDLDMDKTVKQTLEESATIHHQNPFEHELREIEKQLSGPVAHKNEAQLTKLTERYTELQSKRFEHAPPKPTNKIKSVLRTLKVPETWLGQIVGSLSTGQRAIIALAQILSSEADLLLLDEPTNHLDFKRLDILENYLRYFKGTVLMVTHDRYFLDHVCDSILKIEKRGIVEKPDMDKSRFSTRFEAAPIHGALVLELRDLCVGYKKPLLSNINLNVGKGQRIILIGENGIGKSTLFKTIEGRVPAIYGEIIFDSQAK